ncbi:MAG: ParA family protein, partial [Akkermansiaceae bacterium]
ALEGLAQLLKTVSVVRANFNPNLMMQGIVLTMYDSRTNLSKEVVAQVKSFLPKQLYKTLIPRSIRIGEAPSYGLTIFEHDPHGAGAKAYEKLAREFLARRK